MDLNVSVPEFIYLLFIFHCFSLSSFIPFTVLLFFFSLHLIFYLVLHLPTMFSTSSKIVFYSKGKNICDR